MITKQISVFLENKMGRLNEVSQILANNDINISAFTIADTSDFGILRMIVSHPDKALEVLKQNLFSAKSTSVLLVKSGNKPGDLASLLLVLTQENIPIEYMYAFSMDANFSIVVVKPVDVEKCIVALQKHKHELHSIREW